ncbi:30S ribosomal protein S17 [Candidatus Aerophobetes bacterium]|uniref:Small ribosomal subunit protein uS17 n=1 Tax=Aerophobetes bacterium TaxID=2030807 RepID=A0A2A4X7B2_UNCAE|nr:MAG: 30S ribosomal protein S17 [Candidatus Aerophobetes bacterium]
MSSKSTERKLVKATVVSNKMDKTVVLRGERMVPHPIYGKNVKKYKKYYAHCETPLEVGLEVEIKEVRPLSKLKRYIVVSKEKNSSK